MGPSSAGAPHAPDARVRRRRAAVAALLAAWPLAPPGSGTALAAPAPARRFAATYALSFLGLPVGTADLSADLAPERYAIALGGGLSGLAGWFYRGSGSARSAGRLSAAATVPDAFAIDSRYGTAPVRVRVAFAGGAVRRAEVEPEPADKPDRVPVMAADRAGVTDPVGMLAVPVPAGPLTPDLCDRRIPVFDGATRADIVLSRGAVVEVAGGPYRGPALDCRARWVPVAGHRAHGSSVRRMAENDDMRVRLAPVPGGGLLLPLSIAVGTGWGTARIEATAWDAPRGSTAARESPGGPAAAGEVPRP